MNEIDTKKFDAFCKISINNAIKDYKKLQYRRNRLKIAVENIRPSEEEEVEHTLQARGIELPIRDDTLYEAINNLSSKQRDIVVLYYGGFKDREIGEMLGCTENAINKARHKALVLLRSRLHG